jgi:small conductance mechanosensitive channel
MEDFMVQAKEWLFLYGIQALLAVAILIFGRIVAGVARNAIKRVVNKTDAEPGLGVFVGNLVFYMVLAMTAVAALAKFGIETASFVAILGALGFAVGFALQGSLANFASGVMLFVFRPFTGGDYVEAGGVAGTVQQIGVFSTTLNTPDNVRIIVPNGGIYGGTIKNYSANDTRRVDFVFGIGYGDSIEKAMGILKSIADADTRVHQDPDPVFVVGELADSSVNLIVRLWVKKEDYWGVKFDVIRTAKETFDREGISIPFPQRDVHMFQNAGS